MKLDEMTGLRKPMREKLRRNGIKTVEELALVDPRKKMPGFTPAQLARLRKLAQHAIFRTAFARVKRITDETLESIEGALQEATWSAVDAAKLAQKRAEEAVHAAQGRARVLARVAASKTKEAARTAEKEYKSISKRLQRASPQTRKTLEHYEDRAKRALDAAVRASESAKKAVELADRRLKAELKLARKKGQSLVSRLRESVGAGNGSSEFRTTKRVQ